MAHELHADVECSEVLSCQSPVLARETFKVDDHIGRA